MEGCTRLLNNPFLLAEAFQPAAGRRWPGRPHRVGMIVDDDDPHLLRSFVCPQPCQQTVFLQ